MRYAGINNVGSAGETPHATYSSNLSPSSQVGVGVWYMQKLSFRGGPFDKPCTGWHNPNLTLNFLTG